MGEHPSRLALEFIFLRLLFNGRYGHHTGDGSGLQFGVKSIGFWHGSHCIQGGGKLEYILLK